MSKIINKKVINIIFITFFSLAILAQYIVPHNIVLNYWFPIFGVSFFIAAFAYLNSIKVFISLVIISWIVSFGIAKLVFGHFQGYDLIFILLYFKILSVSSTTGFIAAKFCASYVDKNSFNKNKLILFGSGGIILITSIITFIFIDISSENNLKEEIQKRLQLARNINVYYNQSKNRVINNQVVIEQGLTKGFYSVEGGVIKHGYSGDIIISSNDNGISLVYNNIPANEACYMFYFSDSPGIYGFEDTFINDVLVLSRVNYKNTKKGKEICYESDNKVTIRFSGSYIELGKTAQYLYN